MKSNNFEKSIFEEFVLPHLPISETLRKNAERSAKNINERLASYNSSNTYPSNEEFSISHIGLYENSLKGFLKTYNFSKQAMDIILDLENAAIVYIVVLVVKSIGLDLGTGKELRKLETTSKKLLSQLNSDNLSLLIPALALMGEDAWKVRQNYKNDKEESDIISQLLFKRYERLKAELEYLSKVSEYYANTFIGKFLQFASRGPKENSALDIWVRMLADAWVIKARRSLNQSNSKHEGREQFLCFAEDCMISLHPEIEADTIRNSYEKIKSKGEIDYLFNYLD